MQKKQGRTGRGQVRRALAYMREQRGAILFILSFSLSLAALNALEPLLLKHLIDRLSEGPDAAARAIGLAVLALAGLGLVREGVTALSNWMGWKVRLAVQFRLLEATVDRLHTLPLTFHRKESVGGLMTRLDRGIAGFLEAFHEIAFNLVPSVLYLGISLTIMFRLDWRLSLVALAFAPLPAAIGSWASREQIHRERMLLSRWTRIYGRFNEVLSGILTVKSYTMEETEKRRFLGGVRGALGIVVRGVGRDSWVNGSKNVVALAARIAVLALGAGLVMRGQATVGTLVAFLGYIGGLFGPVQGLTNIYQTLRRASVSLDTIFGILDTEDSLGDDPDALKLDGIRGELRFENVSFGYRPGQLILDGIDLRVHPGEVLALVGPSGAGKSSLLALLQRLYDPSAGRVLVDGIDLRRVRQRSLRQQIGVVLQDALLFNDSVAANIAYGRPGATRADIEAAARAANAHDFITRLPAGYDTKVGERGGLLSMGERQRIAIARALLKNPPILILDEATSALDADSEAQVQEALERLMRGRTTLLVAHRLSTVVNADRILVLKDGRIAEEGTHRDLLRRDGYYAHLVRQQTRGLELVTA